MLNVLLGSVFGVVLTLGVIYFYIRYLGKKALKLRKEMNTPKWTKGDFLIGPPIDRGADEFTRQTISQHFGGQIPNIEAEVMEVGANSYLLKLSVPGYAEQEQPYPIMLAHEDFVKNENKKPKPSLTVVK